MYLIGPDEVYKVKVVSSSAWVVEDRILVTDLCMVVNVINIIVTRVTPYDTTPLDWQMQVDIQLGREIGEPKRSQSQNIKPRRPWNRKGASDS